MRPQPWTTLLSTQDTEPLPTMDCNPFYPRHWTTSNHGLPSSLFQMLNHFRSHTYGCSHHILVSVCDAARATGWFWSPREAGIAQWLERQTCDSKVTGLNPCRSDGRIFFSRVNFLCWLLFRYPFHPRVTAVAHKRSRSFCQKCWWQVTAKHAYTLRMWLWIK